MPEQETNYADRELLIRLVCAALPAVYTMCSNCDVPDLVQDTAQETLQIAQGVLEEMKRR